MKAHVILLMIGALILAGCGTRAPTQIATQSLPVTTELPPSDTEPPASQSTKTSMPAVTLSPLLSVTLPYPEGLKVATQKDIVYTKPVQPGVSEKKLDIYHPEGDGPWPVALIIPPIGNYRNTLTALSLGKKLAGQGIVVFVLDAGTEESTYNLTVAAEDNGAAIREVLEEIACGVLMAQWKAKDYGGNPDNLILFGYSIGSLYGINAVLQGEQIKSNWEAFAAKRGGPPAQTECLAEGQAVKVGAFVSYGGNFHLGFLDEVDPELAALLNPAAYVGGNPELGLRCYIT